MTITMARFFLPFQVDRLATVRPSIPQHPRMSTIVLPPELIEAIIDEVGSMNDTETLKACSTVSMAFVYQAQKYLFKAIDLDRPYSSRKKAARRFHRLLTAKPHLGAHVREIRLGDDADDDMEGLPGESWITSTNWKTLLLIPQTLDLLPRLEAISLAFNANSISWKAMPAPTRSALGRVFRMPTLKAVSLAFITSFPPQLLLSLAHLRSVRLSCVEIDQEVSSTDDIPYSTRPEIRLETLFLRGTPPATIAAISQALATSSGSTLRSLAITPTFEDGFCDAVREIMNNCGASITNFEWLPSIHFSSLSHPIDLSALPLLRTLRFSVSFRKAHANGPFSEVLRLLQQVSHSSHSSNRLQMVVLDCHCVRPMDAQKREAEWRPIDKVLARPAFAALHEIKIRLSTKTSTGIDRHNFTLAFQHLLPMLQRKGVLISVTTLDVMTF